MISFPGCIFLNGTVGAGKTTVAVSIGTALQQLGIAHAVIDLDAIRRAWPAPAGDRFNHELELANLASLVENYAEAGIQTFVMAGVIEDAGEIQRYQHALQGRPLMVCRITAHATVLRARLTSRHRDDPEGLGWHLNRAIELDNILAEQSLDDFVVDSTDRSAESVALEVLDLADLHGGPRVTLPKKEELFRIDRTTFSGADADAAPVHPGERQLPPKPERSA